MLAGEGGGAPRPDVCEPRYVPVRSRRRSQHCGDASALFWVQMFCAPGFTAELSGQWQRRSLFQGPGSESPLWPRPCRESGDAPGPARGPEQGSFLLTHSPPVLGFLSSGTQKESRKRERESERGQRPGGGGWLGPGGHEQGAGERSPGPPLGRGVRTCKNSSGDPCLAPPGTTTGAEGDRDEQPGFVSLTPGWGWGGAFLLFLEGAASSSHPLLSSPVFWALLRPHL